MDYQNVVVTEVTSDLKFYAQNVDQGPKLEALMNDLRQEFQTNPPLPGSFVPRKGVVFGCFGVISLFFCLFRRNVCGQVCGR